jgi:MinD superfamily P-loop ATPase
MNANRIKKILAEVTQHSSVPFTLSVVSGKGGVGKTTIAVLLAKMLADRGLATAYIDCDVEAPNGHLLLKPTIETHQTITRLLPEVDATSCSGCGACETVCEFGAIVSLPQGVQVFPNLCLSCGACVTACPNNALNEVPHVVGELEIGRAGPLYFVQGNLRLGEARNIPVIEAVVDSKFPDIDIIVRDAPPGTACPAVAAMEDSDLVLLVTDATPFGLHDLTLITETVRAIKLPAVALVNRSDRGDQRVIDFCDQYDLPRIATIPYSNTVSKAYSNGDMVNVQRELEPQLAVFVQEIINAMRTIKAPA